MELPEDVVAIIREFSRPLTRPDWRTLHKMPMLTFHTVLSMDVIVLKKRNIAYKLMIDLFAGCYNSVTLY